MNYSYWLAGAVVAMTLAGASSSVGQTEGPKKTQWEGVYTEEQAKRGAEAYQASCASCHGPDLRGCEMSPALAGPEFASTWDGLSLGDLFDRIRTSMPLNNPGGLTSRQYSDVLAFMLSQGGAPAGQTELGSRADALQPVRFVATKP